MSSGNGEVKYGAVQWRCGDAWYCLAMVVCGRVLLGKVGCRLVAVECGTVR